MMKRLRCAKKISWDALAFLSRLSLDEAYGVSLAFFHLFLVLNHTPWPVDTQQSDSSVHVLLIFPNSFDNQTIQISAPFNSPK